MGGRFNNTAPTLTDGQQGDLQLDNKGNLQVRIAYNGTGAVIQSGGADAVTNGNAQLIVAGLQYSFNGSSWDRRREPTTFKAVASTAIGSETTIWTPAAGKKFRLMGFTISVSAAASIVLKDNTAGTTIFQTPKLVADTPYVVTLGNGILSAAANNVLTATSSAAANVIGTFYGTEE